MNNECYIVEIILDNQSLFLLWNGESKYPLPLGDDSKIAHFQSDIEAGDFSKKIGWNVVGDITYFNFDELKKFIDSPNPEFDEKFILNAWNFFDDVAISKTHDEKNELRKEFNKNLDIHEKLFLSRDIFSEDQSTRYMPPWTNNDLNRITNFMSLGLRIFRQYVIGK